MKIGKPVKFVAIMSGGDWADASVEHLVAPRDMGLVELKKKYDIWYSNVWMPALNNEEPMEFMNFSQYLIQNGARKTTDDELEEFWDTP